MSTTGKGATPPLSIADRHALLGSAFSPNSPINTKQLFCGRIEQLRRVLQVAEEAGVHGVLYGERGVGKTSLSNIMPEAMPLDLCVRVAAEKTDSLVSLMNKIGKRIVLRTKEDRGMLRSKSSTQRRFFRRRGRRRRRCTPAADSAQTVPADH